MISPRFVPLASRILGWLCALVAAGGALATLGFLALSGFAAVNGEWMPAAFLGAVSVAGAGACVLTLLVSYLLLNWTRWVAQQTGAAAVFN